jgi:hypothetical protein
MDYKFELNAKSKILLLQTIYQSALNFGGWRSSKTYFEKNGNSQTFGGRLGWQNKEVVTKYNQNNHRKVFNA